GFHGVHPGRGEQDHRHQDPERFANEPPADPAGQLCPGQPATDCCRQINHPHCLVFRFVNMLATGSERTNSYNIFFCPWSLKPMPLSARRDATPDPYAWMEQRDSDEVIQHLHAENRHTEQWLAAHNDQRGQLFEEIRGRIRETDLSLPAVWGPWLYYQRTEAG